MRIRQLSILALTSTFLCGQAKRPDIPRTWAASGVTSFEVPLADAHHSPVHITEEAYYRIPARQILKTYPVYRPDREPAGYQEWLKQQEPQIAFDPSVLHTEEEWVRAGELVFNYPASFGPVFFSASDLRNRDFYEQTGMPVGKDGVVPFARWVIREKGKVELGSMGCNTCHTRVMPDGSVVPGAQGNNPGDREGARLLRLAKMGSEEKALEAARRFARQFEVPWVKDDVNARAQSMTLDQLIAGGEAIPPGVTARSGTSMFLPPQIPDLIGVKERRYLDHTGLVRQRDIGDLMRYCSLVQDTMTLARYGDVPAQQASTAGKSRYSDEQLYALALYLYSLKPPPNPHLSDAQAKRGEQVFERERCGRCHAPPLYTNNRLVPAEGFEPPAEHKTRFDLNDERVGTDPGYTLGTRKGTGYYKVPSLKGVWYRSPLEHNGSVGTLEEWFDPARLGSTFRSTGFIGAGITGRPVTGHRFGLQLTPEDKASLIAFLKTL